MRAIQRGLLPVHCNGFLYSPCAVAVFRCLGPVPKRLGKDGKSPAATFLHGLTDGRDAARAGRLRAPRELERSEGRTITNADDRAAAYLTDRAEAIARRLCARDVAELPMFEEPR